MKNKILIVILIVISIISCKKGEYEIENEYLEKNIKTVSLGNSVKWVVILPGMGCHGCIREGESFMVENINNTNILFILTKTESLKILQNKLEIKLKNHSNIYIDSKEVFNIPTINNVYPCIVKITNGEIISHEFQSPGNNAFENLTNRLEPIEE